MALNSYISSNAQGEQNLYNSLVEESIKVYGQNVYYMPRSEYSANNSIFNESIETKYDDSYLIEMFIENTQGFEGEGNLLSKFGLEIRDEATFIVSKNSWSSTIGNILKGERNTPFEGDLLYLPLSKSLFEITFVDIKPTFFQLSNQTSYKIQAKLFEYNDEEFNTDIDDIDSELQLTYGSITSMVLESVTGEGYEIGEKIKQDFDDGSYITADVLEFDNNTIKVNNIETSDGNYHEFIEKSVIVGLVTDTQSIIASKGISKTTTGSQNDLIEETAKRFIDFDEKNAFGEL